MCKIAVPLEPIMQFVCPLRFRIYKEKNKYYLFYDKRGKLKPFGCNWRLQAMGKTHPQKDIATTILNRPWDPFSENRLISHEKGVGM